MGNICQPARGPPPLKGDGAYEYKTKNIVGSDYDFNHFRATRKHDQQIFGIKVSKKKVTTNRYDPELEEWT
jgi:hypothetical protein